MKRLVIHPDDRSTDFLKPVYVDRFDATVVTDGRTKRDKLRDLIESHDQVIMMGHGGGFGLFAGPKAYGNIIDRSFADQLRERDNSIFIWCHADKFVKYHNLKGFYSGMFVSEMGEVYACNLPWWTNEEHLCESNAEFVNAMRAVDLTKAKKAHAGVSKLYGRFTKHNPVAKYNHERLYAS